MKRTIAAFIFAILTLTFSIQVIALDPSGNVIYDGIDVSADQGEIDFEAVKAAGKEAVFIRASAADDYTDPYFSRNFEDADANGLLTGIYHFMTAKTTDEARTEAEYFVSVIGDADPDFRLAMDYGETSGLSAAEINANATAFLERVSELTGRGMCIYTDSYNAGNIYDSSLAVYPLWVAEYGTEEPSDNGNWSAWSGFQYSDSGNVAGISTVVDLDYFTDALLDEIKPPSTGGAALILISVFAVSALILTRFCVWQSIYPARKKI